MSTLKDRQREIAETQYAEDAAKAVARMDLKAEYRERQGEFLGDMAGAFGAFAKTGWTGLFMSAMPVFVLFSLGAAAAAGLFAAIF